MRVVTTGVYTHTPTQESDGSAAQAAVTGGAAASTRHYAATSAPPLAYVCHSRVNKLVPTNSNSVDGNAGAAYAYAAYAA